MATDRNVLRLGIIGTGSVVREIYQYLYFRSLYSREISVEAACDTSAEALASFGDAWGIPVERRFADYRKMIGAVPLDAVAVNTPDSAHREPVISALEAGLDVVLPKPTADRIADAHAMIEAVRATGRFLGVDFHKREDPVVKEARARVARGEYGTLQSSVWHMLDRLVVADPNREPRFFASPDFAERNSPITFLTTHMADTFIHITGRRPLEVRSVGYRQKLPSLSPIAVGGWDLVDSTILFEGGSLCHIITGWALPDPADCLTVQSAALVFSDGMLELWQDHYGYREVTSKGIEMRNVLFKAFERDGLVTGFGMDCPGRIVRNILRFRHGEMADDERAELLSPFSLGFYTTLVCECAIESLARGSARDEGVVVGETVDARRRLREAIGDAADFYYR
jgi:predicted dehydrogenase